MQKLLLKIRTQEVDKSKDSHALIAFEKQSFQMKYMVFFSGMYYVVFQGGRQSWPHVIYLVSHTMNIHERGEWSKSIKLFELFR